MRGLASSGRIVLVAAVIGFHAEAATLTVPSSASIHGAASAFFHSDLWAMNRSRTNSIPVTATYRCFTGPCPTSFVAAFTLAPRESRLFADVVGTLFHAPETAGAIELMWNDAAGQISALTRVYTPRLPAPTFGTAIPALPASASRTRALFLGVGMGGGPPGGFRTNAGAYNPSDFSVTATFQLHTESGPPLGVPVTLVLGPHQAGQVNDVFFHAGAASTSTNIALVATATAPVFFDVTVIDNQSGDSVFALQSADEAGPAAGTNLLANGGFDHDAAGWTPAASYSVAFSPVDAEALPTSGSALVTNALQGAVGANGISQCARVMGKADLHLTGKARILPGQATHGSAQLRVFTFPNLDCTGPVLDDKVTGVASGAVDAWGVMDAEFTTHVSAASARVFTALEKNETTGSFQAYFDDLSLTPITPTTLTIPASASIHGQAGTFFHTDLWAANRSFVNALNVTAHLRCATGHCTETTKTFSLVPRESKLFEDVVGSFFFSPEASAAIELTYDSGLGGLAATSRTYTPSLPQPTKGTAIPAQPIEEAKVRALFLGLGASGGDLTKGFRTNVGAYNALALGTTVTLSLYDAAGHLLGTKVYLWPALQAFQVNDVFTELGAGSVVTTNAYLVATAPLPFFFYATVIDNQSGDSFYVGPSDDEP